MTVATLARLALLAALAAAALMLRERLSWSAPRGPRTVEEVRRQFGDRALGRLKPLFEASGVAYPPKEAVFLAMKEEAALELWAGDGRRIARITIYPIRRLSGGPGPKLREGDGQVPEGKYRIASLNPNSAYHLSMKLDYPNESDLARARREGRRSPGSDIFIHGKDVSIGCLAMGDEAIEELFLLVADAGRRSVSVVIAPRDPRKGRLVAGPGLPAWTAGLYRDIEREFRRFARPKP